MSAQESWEAMNKNFFLPIKFNRQNVTSVWRALSETSCELTHKQTNGKQNKAFLEEVINDENKTTNMGTGRCTAKKHNYPCQSNAVSFLSWSRKISVSIDATLQIFTASLFHWLILSCNQHQLSGYLVASKNMTSVCDHCLACYFFFSPILKIHCALCVHCTWRALLLLLTLWWHRRRRRKYLGSHAYMTPRNTVSQVCRLNHTFLSCFFVGVCMEVLWKDKLRVFWAGGFRNITGWQSKLVNLMPVCLCFFLIK